jgi:hypothetical protein
MFGYPSSLIIKDIDAAALDALAIPIAQPVAPILGSRPAPKAANETKESATEPEVDLKIGCSEGISSASKLDEL